MHCNRVGRCRRCRRCRSYHYEDAHIRFVSAADHRALSAQCVRVCVCVDNAEYRISCPVSSPVVRLHTLLCSQMHYSLAAVEQNWSTTTTQPISIIIIIIRCCVHSACCQCCRCCVPVAKAAHPKCPKRISDQPQTNNFRTQCNSSNNRWLSGSLGVAGLITHSVTIVCTYDHHIVAKLERRP